MVHTESLSPAAYISVDDLYRAYRKAKSEAFRDRTHFSSNAYVSYEGNLATNIAALHERLCAHSSNWMNDLGFIGGYSYLPKSLTSPLPEKDRDIQFATLDPLRDWQYAYASEQKRVKAEFRLTMTPTVDFQIISALWIMKVGHKFDALLDRDLSYAHRLRRVGGKGPLAIESPALFEHYISGFRKWRSKGLDAIRSALLDGKGVVAVTMDIKRFYHRVSPNFLLRKAFVGQLGLGLTVDDQLLTHQLVASLNLWYSSTPDYHSRPEGSLPVGLSASRIIANVLLAEFDKAIAKRLKPLYYGRYADDIFLVVRTPMQVKSGERFVRWLRKRMQGFLVLDRQKDGSSLRLRLSYAKDSEIVFSREKQKIFFLSGEHGLDLVDQIVEKIKEHSSEYRRLPELPLEQSKMVAQALLATPDARLEADAIRKAEAVSLRRLGFSYLLGDVEAYARDLAPNDWREIRLTFYGLVHRYVLTPVGWFDYFSYVVRVFGLMVACGDYGETTKFLDRFGKVCELLRKTTTAGTSQQTAFDAAKKHYMRGFTQATYEAGTVVGFTFGRMYYRLLRRIATEVLQAFPNPRSISLGYLRADLGRRPYYGYWLDENKRERNQPPLPPEFSVKRVLVLTRHFRQKVRDGLAAPFWPAVAFPTRPIPLWRLTVAARNLMLEEGGIERALWATRGARVNPAFPHYSFIRSTADGLAIGVPGDERPIRTIAVPSVLTTDAQFSCAIAGKQDRSLARYAGIRSFVNKILRDSPEISYVAFPECSLPLDWALGIAQKLGQRGISFIAGVENRDTGGLYRNEALVSLASNYFGVRGAVCFLQQKIAMAHAEAKECKAAKKRFVCPDRNEALPVYTHGGLCFGVLICSDLTTIANRAHFQGKVDLLFVLEWNRDVSTFEFLVESAAHDLHAAVVQINNRKYGDSRIRVPFEEPYRRDVVRVKGGDENFYVVSSIDFGHLRRFQRNEAGEKGFKPIPIGFKMSKSRQDCESF